MERFAHWGHGGHEGTETQHHGQPEQPRLSWRDFEFLYRHNSRVAQDNSGQATGGDVVPNQQVQTYEQEYASHQRNWRTNAATLQGMRDIFGGNVSGYMLFAGQRHDYEKDVLFLTTGKRDIS